MAVLAFQIFDVGERVSFANHHLAIVINPCAVGPREFRDDSFRAVGNVALTYMYAWAT
jgi:hypothetical protein